MYESTCSLNEHDLDMYQKVVLTNILHMSDERREKLLGVLKDTESLPDLLALLEKDLSMYDSLLKLRLSLNSFLRSVSTRMWENEDYYVTFELRALNNFAGKVNITVVSTISFNGTDILEVTLNSNIFFEKLTDYPAFLRHAKSLLFAEMDNFKNKQSPRPEMLVPGFAKCKDPAERYHRVHHLLEKLVEIPASVSKCMHKCVGVSLSSIPFHGKVGKEYVEFLGSNMDTLDVYFNKFIVTCHSEASGIVIFWNRSTDYVIVKNRHGEYYMSNKKHDIHKRSVLAGQLQN